MKRKTIFTVFGCAVVVLALAALFFLWLPFDTIRRLQARYKQVQRGMAIEQVQGIMAYPPSKLSAHWGSMWDDEPLPSADSQRIRSAIRYTVPTFYLPLSFEFTFDSEGRLT